MTSVLQSQTPTCRPERETCSSTETRADSLNCDNASGRLTGFIAPSFKNDQFLNGYTMTRAWFGKVGKPRSANLARSVDARIRTMSGQPLALNQRAPDQQTAKVQQPQTDKCEPHEIALRKRNGLLEASKSSARSSCSRWARMPQSPCWTFRGFGWARASSGAETPWAFGLSMTRAVSKPTANRFSPVWLNARSSKAKALPDSTGLLLSALHLVFVDKGQRNHVLRVYFYRSRI